MRRPSLPALLAGFALAGPCLAQADEAALFDRRVAWWAHSDHILDLSGVTPLETIAGGPGAPIPRADPERRTISTRALGAAIAYVRPLNTQGLLVWQGGALQLEWYGAGADAASRASTASMMKPVMVLALGVALDRGLIRSLDEPVETWLPEWRGEPRGRITLRHLLEMTSGLQKDGGASGGGRGAALMLGTRLEETLLATPLVREPGTAFDYNTVDSGLLGLILQRASGRRYADWVSEALWRPLGAADAGAWLDRPGGLARAFCCLVATPRDWLRLGLLIKDGGVANGRRIVSASWIDQMTAASPRNPNFGFQIWRASPYTARRGYGSGAAPAAPAAAPFLADDMVYFDGAVGQRVYISRSRDLVIVRTGSSAPSWDDSVLPNLIVSGLDQPSGASPG